jgi:hypothetical protein
MLSQFHESLTIYDCADFRLGGEDASGFRRGDNPKSPNPEISNSKSAKSPIHLRRFSDRNYPKSQSPNPKVFGLKLSFDK